MGIRLMEITLCILYCLEASVITTPTQQDYCARGERQTTQRISGLMAAAIVAGERKNFLEEEARAPSGRRPREDIAMTDGGVGMDRTRRQNKELGSTRISPAAASIGIILIIFLSRAAALPPQPTTTSRGGGGGGERR